MLNFIKTKIYRKYLYLFILLLAIYIAFYIFFIFSKNHEINSLNIELTDLYIKEKTYNSVILKNEQLAKQNQELSLEINNLNSSQDINKNLLNSLLNSFEKYSLNCLKYEQISKIKKESYKYNVYRFYIQGNFDNLISFITSDLISKNFIKIKNIYSVNLENKGPIFSLDLKIMSFKHENKI